MTRYYNILLENTNTVKTFYVFLFICAIALTNNWIVEHFIMTQEFYINTLSERMEIHRIDEYYHWIKKFSVWNYVIFPVFILLRITIVTLMIQLPFVLQLKDVPFSKIFRVVTFALLSLILLNVAHTITLLRMPVSEINQDALAMIPCSAATFVNIDSVSKPFYALLGSFNIFELFWCVAVFLGLNRFLKVNQYDAISTVVVVWAFIEIFKFLLMSYLNRIYA